MPQYLDPFGFTNEDQPKYETGQNLDEDGPQSNEIPFPTLDTEEDGNGPQNEYFENVPMPSPCDERLLDEALDQQRDEMEADNLMFDEPLPHHPWTWVSVKYYAQNSGNALTPVIDRIAETITENIDAFGELIATKHYIRAVAKGVLESALTNDTPVVTLRRSGDSIIIAGKGKADLVVDVLNCANTPAKPAPLADTEERHPDDGVLGDDNDPEGLKEWREMWRNLARRNGTDTKTTQITVLESIRAVLAERLKSEAPKDKWENTQENRDKIRAIVRDVLENTNELYGYEVQEAKLAYPDKLTVRLKPRRGPITVDVVVPSTNTNEELENPFVVNSPEDYLLEGYDNPTHDDEKAPDYDTDPYLGDPLFDDY